MNPSKHYVDRYRCTIIYYLVEWLFIFYIYKIFFIFLVLPTYYTSHGVAFLVHLHFSPCTSTYAAIKIKFFFVHFIIYLNLYVHDDDDDDYSSKISFHCTIFMCKHSFTQNMKSSHFPNFTEWIFFWFKNVN